MRTDQIQFRLTDKPRKDFLIKIGFKEVQYRSENLGKICGIHYMSKIVSVKSGRIKNYYNILLPNYFNDRNEQIKLEVHACTKDGRKIINYPKIKTRGEGEKSKTIEIPQSAKEPIPIIVIAYVAKLFGVGKKKKVEEPVKKKVKKKVKK